MKEIKGVIYILTNPSFPEYVKLGYADNVEERLKELNRSECIPFAFRVYATYAVKTRLKDKDLHNLIDKLNPNLRAIDEFNGKPRKKEFYNLSPEDAYSILESIAEISGTTDGLTLIKPSVDAIKDEDEASEIREKKSPLKKPTLIHLINWGIITLGETLYYNAHPEDEAILVDEKGFVNYKGQEMTYMNWGRKVLKNKNFNFYERVYRKGSNKTLSEERYDYMIEHNIPIDEDFIDKKINL